MNDTLPEDQCDKMRQNATETGEVPLRQIRAIEMLLNGETHSEIADQLNIHRATLERWLKAPGFIKEKKALVEMAKEEIRGRIVDIVLNSITSLEKETDPEKGRPVQPWLALTIISKFGDGVFGKEKKPGAARPSIYTRL